MVAFGLGKVVAVDKDMEEAESDKMTVYLDFVKAIELGMTAVVSGKEGVDLDFGIEVDLGIEAFDLRKMVAVDLDIVGEVVLDRMEAD